MKNILVKGSGDITDSQQFFDFVVEKTRNNYVVIICGAGTKISDALKKYIFTKIEKQKSPFQTVFVLCYNEIS